MRGPRCFYVLYRPRRLRYMQSCMVAARALCLRLQQFREPHLQCCLDHSTARSATQRSALFQAWLSRNSPSISNTLLPPATLEEMAQAEQQLGAPLPAALRALYRCADALQRLHAQLGHDALRLSVQLTAAFPLDLTMACMYVLNGQVLGPAWRCWGISPSLRTM